MRRDSLPEGVYFWLMLVFEATQQNIMSELTQTKLTLLAWLLSPARTVADIRPSGERDTIHFIFLPKSSEHIPAFSGEKSTSTAGEVARK